VEAAVAVQQAEQVQLQAVEHLLAAVAVVAWQAVQAVAVALEPLVVAVQVVAEQVAVVDQVDRLLLVQLACLNLLIA
jgi:hypothetical protein